MIKSENGTIQFQGSSVEILAEYTCINYKIVGFLKDYYDKRGTSLNETDIASILIAGSPEFYIEFMKMLASGLEDYMEGKKNV